MKSYFPKPLVLAGAIAGLALLPACSEADTAEPTDTATKEEPTLTLAAALGEVPDMASLNGAIANAELASIFEGPASYTVLAPNDAAFTALGDRGKVLMTEEQRPVLAGILREHILPGHLTPESISQAIEDKGGEVSMTTFGGNTVTFSKDGDTIVASNGSGGEAHLAAGATAATNGVIIPIDTVLVPGEEG